MHLTYAEPLELTHRTTRLDWTQIENHWFKRSEGVSGTSVSQKSTETFDWLAVPHATRFKNWVAEI